ncbi:MAG TPA: hypothetical protein VML75_23230, partial [Kofleriaceae bacterium]|nr:hypothetical protein [Kofleriaceae bacterium]
RFNNWQKAAFGAWGLGALLIIIGVANIGSEASASTAIGLMVAGVVALATGGSLHKVGSSRERKD